MIKSRIVFIAIIPATCLIASLTGCADESAPFFPPADVTSAPEADTLEPEVAEVDAGEPRPVYHAVVVVDGWKQGDPCTASGRNTEGYDLDAVGLFRDGDLLAYAQEVFASDGVEGPTGCGYDNAAPDPNRALGAPDSTNDSGFVSLNGGGLGVEFGALRSIKPGDTVTVYESDCNACVDEPFSANLATDITCLENAGNDVMTECAFIPLGSNEGTTSFEIPDTAF